MSNCNWDSAYTPPCPVCKTGTAFMGSTAWGHDHMCCSDKCGVELKQRLDKFENTEQYKQLRNKIANVESELASAYEEATGVSARHQIRYFR